LTKWAEGRGLFSTGYPHMYITMLPNRYIRKSDIWDIGGLKCQTPLLYYIHKDKETKERIIK